MALARLPNPDNLRWLSLGIHPGVPCIELKASISLLTFSTSCQYPLGFIGRVSVKVPNYDLPDQAYATEMRGGVVDRVSLALEVDR
jgi:hypothetical protein